MKVHRHRMGIPAGTTAVAPAWKKLPSASSDGIPLLLLPERVVFQVDASLLMAMDPLPDDHPAPGEGVVRRMVATMARLCVRPWEV
jgi:hypothetical protein